MAQYNLGAMYAKGVGVPKNEGESIKWYQKAVANWRNGAEHDDVESQLWLGVMHRQGSGVPKDSVEAYKWFVLSSAEPRRYGVACRDQIVRQMTPEEIAEGKKRADAFVPKK
jgi:TPR repeat protein